MSSISQDSASVKLPGGSETCEKRKIQTGRRLEMTRHARGISTDGLRTDWSGLVVPGSSSQSDNGRSYRKAQELHIRWWFQLLDGRCYGRNRKGVGREETKGYSGHRLQAM